MNKCTCQIVKVRPEWKTSPFKIERCDFCKQNEAIADAAREVARLGERPETDDEAMAKYDEAIDRLWNMVDEDLMIRAAAKAREGESG